MKLQSGRPQVDLTEQDQGQHLDMILDVLADPATNKIPTLFSQERKLVICEITDDNSLSVVHGPDQDDLRAWMVTHVDFQKTQMVRPPGGGTPVSQLAPTAPTDQLFKAFLALKEWRNVPALKDTSHLPVVTRTGEVVTTSGYHPDIQVFLGPMKDIPLADPPPDEWVERAKQLLLEELLGDFEFAAEEDLANALAAIISAPMRFMWDCPLPMYLFDATNKGSGKGTLASVIGETWGVTVSQQTLPDDENEIRKIIVSNLLNPDSAVVVWDNVQHKVGGPAINSLLTSSVFEGRILGKNQNVRLPNNRLWCVTGNNIALGADMGRRVVKVRLQPREDPRRREPGFFRHANIVKWAHDNRDALMWAALVLVKKWTAEGSPKANISADNYTEWAEQVGGVLEVVGISGFLRDRDKITVELDDDEEELLIFLEAISGQVGDAEFMPRDVIQMFAVPGFIDTFPGKVRWTYDRGGDVVKSIGRYLNDHRGEFCGAAATYVEKAPTWTVRHKSYRIRNGTGRSNVSHVDTHTRPWAV